MGRGLSSGFPPRAAWPETLSHEAGVVTVALFLWRHDELCIIAVRQLLAEMHSLPGLAGTKRECSVEFSLPQD
jgi:hypothetical protein